MKNIGDIHIIIKPLDDKRTVAWKAHVYGKMYGSYIEVNDTWEEIQEGVGLIFRQAKKAIQSIIEAEEMDDEHWLDFHEKIKNINIS